MVKKPVTDKKPIMWDLLLQVMLGNEHGDRKVSLTWWAFCISVANFHTIFMPNLTPTPQEVMLSDELRKRGIELETQYWDNHKHIDIYIPKAKIAIEIDGLQHFLNPLRVSADFHRDYYSNKEGVFTKHIPNELIESHLHQIADAIEEVVKMEELK
jgi:very-short-patch-repair endonuclease